MSSLLRRLLPKERRGSKPRCHWITHGDGDQVAARLTAIVEPWATVSSADQWMPQGFVNTVEPQLHLPTPLMATEKQLRLAEWWLPPNRLKARTPNFDIASTCTIDGRPGLLLVEAKAHAEELRGEAAGRRLPPNASEGRKASHVTIGTAIEEARAGLSESTNLPFSISRDTHYQMSNRFAWAWKLTQLGIPVVLVYLGFTNSVEMSDRGQPFSDHASWEACVLDHSQTLFTSKIWNQRWLVNNVAFIPLIASMQLTLDHEIES